MTHPSKHNRFSSVWFLSLLALLPAQLGAKGCDVGHVGNDDCPRGECGSGGTNGNDGGDSGVVCGGLTGAPCDAGQFCDFPANALCGAADATGVCKALPEVCADIYAPVCGCDDRTYGNACEANSNGVSVAHEGECGSSGGVDCGGLLGLACGAGEFCNYPEDALCGAADATGICTVTPEACDLVFAPVCGCNGTTYSNECEANRNGVSVAHQGECERGGTGADCGGLLGLACGAGEFCNYPPDALCGAADATGLCTEIPQACDAVLAPVCGCNGTTYSSECEANRQGISIVHRGECERGGSEPDFCGGFAGLSCPKGEYCKYAPDAHCGFADQTGVCEAMPETCTEEYQPVCGCNGQTYSNACYAARAGVSVASSGPCR